MNTVCRFIILHASSGGWGGVEKTEVFSPPCPPTSRACLRAHIIIVDPEVVSRAGRKGYQQEHLNLQRENSVSDQSQGIVSNSQFKMPQQDDNDNVKKAIHVA